jgi:hypothetical protein
MNMSATPGFDALWDHLPRQLMLNLIVLGRMRRAPRAVGGSKRRCDDE